MADPAIDELWAKVSASWDDEKAHAAFLELSRLRGELPAAAARYRAAREASDDEATRALLEKRLKGIALLALLELDAARNVDPPATVVLAHRVIRWAALLFFLGALVVLGLVLAK